jgi:hypothetical protein
MVYLIHMNPADLQDKRYVHVPGELTVRRIVLPMQAAHSQQSFALFQL